MQKHVCILLLCIIVMLSAVACDNGAKSAQTLKQTVTSASTIQEEDMQKIKITVGTKSYFATLYDNAATRGFIKMLPVTVDMNELNGNEKYCYMREALPTDASVPLKIDAGDLMLYGDSCLVLFYEDFSTSYSYTPLGKIDDPIRLKQSVGSGNVTVTFSK